MRDPGSSDPPPTAAPARHLDVRGYLCPLPARLSERAMRDLRPGDHLEIVGDDPVMVIDIPAWCDDQGHRLLRCEKDGNLVRCRVEKR